MGDVVEKPEIVVSVVMPAYNAEKYIAKAMESVMEQTAAFGIELLIIDDGCSDGTEQIVTDYQRQMDQSGAMRQIRYLKNDGNKGVAESRNYGIREAKGCYVAFLDSDDWWTSEKLSRQVAYLEKTKAVLCCTARELVDEDGESMHKIIRVPERINYKMLLRTNSIPCSSVVMKTEVAREFYMCHDELHEDYILWLQVLKKYGEVSGIDEPMLMCRQSSGGKSRNKFKSAKMHYGVYRYMGINPVVSLYYFLQYMVRGVLKYR